MDYRGQCAIVTGGASGLGAAVCERLATGGAKIVIFDIDEMGGTAQAERVSGYFAAVDVTSEPAVVAGLDAAEAVFGTPRILVNCAGVAPCIQTLRDAGPHPVDAFRKTVEINLVGTFIVLSRFAQRAAKGGLSDDESGVIINTSSIAAFDGQIGQAAYAASKAAIAGMTLPLARDLARSGIRVMTIAPGVFDTPFIDKLHFTLPAEMGSQTPYPSRLGKPEEFAMLVESLITNPMMNGEVVRIDGALRLAPH